MSDDFNPRSTDAMFAEILANQKRDREERAEFRAEVKESLRVYGHRITALETFKTSLKAKVTIISAAVAARIQLRRGTQGGTMQALGGSAPSWPARARVFSFGGVALRLGVKKVGCNGWAYTFDIAKELDSAAHVFDGHEAKVVGDAFETMTKGLRISRVLLRPMRAVGDSESEMKGTRGYQYQY